MRHAESPWWTERESNPRHKDFQSFALPTELSVLNVETNIGNHDRKFKTKNAKKSFFNDYTLHTNPYTPNHSFTTQHFKHMVETWPKPNARRKYTKRMDKERRLLT